MCGGFEVALIAPKQSIGCKGQSGLEKRFGTTCSGDYRLFFYSLKSINTYFYLLGDGMTEIVRHWVDEFRGTIPFAPKDAVFPRFVIQWKNSFSIDQTAASTTAIPPINCFNSNSPE